MLVMTRGRALSTWCALFLPIFLLPILTSCGGPPAARDVDESSAYATEEFIDWASLDYRFMRYPLAKAYFFNRLRMGEAYRKYREQTWYEAPMQAVTLEAFLELGPDIQEVRRQKARDHHREAMKFHRIILRGWEIWIMSQKHAVADEALIHEMGIITPAIKHLKMATGLNPSDAIPWYDLAYLAGIVGDRELQDQSLRAGLKALETPQLEMAAAPWRKSENLARLRLRLLLETGWARRDAGYFAAGLEATQEAITQMAGDDLQTLDEAQEAMLLQALLMVDLGHVHEARQLARKLPQRDLFLQKPPFEYQPGARPALMKNNLEKFSSDFMNDWVWIMTFLALGEKDQALARMSERNYLTEFPPHLNYRYWRDLGRVLEHFGARADARLAYGFSILYYPYFPYFPLQGGRGISRVVDQTGCGETYYLGYQNFYVSGSYFSYAANRIVAMEMAEDSTAVKQLGERAVESLSTCIRRGIRPAASLALRGRAWYRLDVLDRALADLQEADRQLRKQDQESHEVLKLMAIIHFDQKNDQACLDVLERYLELRPFDGFGWRTSGLALANLERFDEAKAVMERAVRVDPETVAGWYNLALLHLHLGEVDRARALLDEAQDRFPDQVEVTRLQKLIRENPDQPIQMVSGPIELQVFPRGALWFDTVTTTSSLDLTASLGQQEAEEMLPGLWQRYRNDPGLESRLVLVRTLAHVGRTREVQDLLSPLWPTRLTRDEAIQLLMADRELGAVDRALEAAESLGRVSDPFPDGEFWALVAAICLENGESGAGHTALAVVRQMDPDNPILAK